MSVLVEAIIGSFIGTYLAHFLFKQEKKPLLNEVKDSTGWNKPLIEFTEPTKKKSVNADDNAIKKDYERQKVSRETR